MNVTYIHSINETNHISINYDNNYIHKYYASFLSSKNNEDLSLGSEYDAEKQICFRLKNIILVLLLKQSNSFKCQVSLLLLLLAEINYNHICIRLLDTLNTQIAKLILMIK